MEAGKPGLSGLQFAPVCLVRGQPIALGQATASPAREGGFVGRSGTILNRAPRVASKKNKKTDCIQPVLLPKMLVRVLALLFIVLGSKLLYLQQRTIQRVKNNAIICAF